MEKELILPEKQILFVPAPEDVVLNVENHFRADGIRFTWVDGHRELCNRLKTMPPAPSNNNVIVAGSGTVCR